MGNELLIRIIADGAVLPVIVIGAYMLVFKVPREKRFNAYVRILMAGLTAYLLGKLIGSVYQPADIRPFEALGVSAGALFLNNPGFPSDHALFVTAIACAVWFETKQKLVSLLLALLVVAVCVGRVLALVHSPMDVIFGVLIGLTGALWYVSSSSWRIQATPSLPK